MPPNNFYSKKSSGCATMSDVIEHYQKAKEVEEGKNGYPPQTPP